MTKLNTPANQALKHFFDDLTQEYAHDVADNSQTFDEKKPTLPPLKQVIDVKGETFKTVSDSISSQKNNLKKSQETVNKHSDEQINDAQRLLDNASALSSSSIDEQDLEVANETENLEQNYKENQALADYIDINSVSEVKPSLRDSLPARFQVLFCDIAGMTIAVPLTELGSILKIGKLNKMAKSTPWCKGILVKGDCKYTCIDGAALLDVKNSSVATGKNDSNKQTEKYSFALQVGKSTYAICCNEVSHTVEISKDDIKWRQNSHKQPWLPGILKEKMCVLLDGAKMVQDVLA